MPRVTALGGQQCRAACKVALVIVVLLGLTELAWPPIHSLVYNVLTIHNTKIVVQWYTHFLETTTILTTAISTVLALIILVIFVVMVAETRKQGDKCQFFMLFSLPLLIVLAVELLLGVAVILPSVFLQLLERPAPVLLYLVYIRLNIQVIHGRRNPMYVLIAAHIGWLAFCSWSFSFDKTVALMWKSKTDCTLEDVSSAISYGLISPSPMSVGQQMNRLMSLFTSIADQSKLGIRLEEPPAVCDLRLMLDTFWLVSFHVASFAIATFGLWELTG